MKKWMLALLLVAVVSMGIGCRNKQEEQMPTEMTSQNVAETQEATHETEPVDENPGIVGEVLMGETDPTEDQVESTAATEPATEVTEPVESGSGITIPLSPGGGDEIETPADASGGVL